MFNIIVGQSGGPTAVINASLYGVIKEAMASTQIDSIYGMRYGIEGLMQDKYIDINEQLNEEELERLRCTPAAFLGSCRYKLPEDLKDEFYPMIFEKLEKMNIGAFFYIGGNDSMDTVSKMSRYADMIKSNIRFIGIPKTIDNDLIETDHTPGFASAAKYVASTVREIVLDASVYQQKSVTIVEIMGRHAGWLTAASVLARKENGDNPVLIYLPEADFDMDKFEVDVKKELERRPNVIVCISEGISDKNGTFICEYENETQTDNFGHKMLTGSGKVLESFIRNRLGVKVRSVELNVSQRCSGMVASLTDNIEAKRAGSEAVKAALAGKTGKMIAFDRQSDKEYSIKCTPKDVNIICNQEKKFPKEWISKDGSDIGNEFIEYLTPLIQGEVEHKMKNGLPDYLYL